MVDTSHLILNFWLFMSTSYYLIIWFRLFEFENQYIRRMVGQRKRIITIFLFKFCDLQLVNTFHFWSLELYMEFWVFFEYTCCHNVNLFLKIRSCMNLIEKIKKDPINNSLCKVGLSWCFCLKMIMVRKFYHCTPQCDSPPTTPKNLTFF